MSFVVLSIPPLNCESSEILFIILLVVVGPQCYLGEDVEYVCEGKWHSGCCFILMLPNNLLLNIHMKCSFDHLSKVLIFCFISGIFRITIIINLVGSVGLEFLLCLEVLVKWNNLFQIFLKHHLWKWLFGDIFSIPYHTSYQYIINIKTLIHL